MPEFVVLLDENHQPIGKAEKLSAHTANTPLHLAFSCYIFNEDGELLITRRAASKKVWPGYWTNSVCGHPAPDESIEDAIIRRAEFELGMKIKEIKCVLPDYRYKTPPDNGIIENEFCPVFFAQAASEPSPNPEEVSDLKWLSWEQFKQEIEQNPDKYSYWCKDQLKQFGNETLVRSDQCLMGLRVNQYPKGPTFASDC